MIKPSVLRKYNQVIDEVQAEVWLLTELNREEQDFSDEFAEKYKLGEFSE
ncbi:hypothetical protein [uncultured Vagococcus sp.]|nr:hypothetical protein [uncultured Vagococcus sp.]